MTKVIGSGIYKITNTVNGKVYIGATSNFDNRWRQHRWQLRKNSHSNSKLQNAWNKHGEESFYFSVIYLCTREELRLAEQRFLDEYLAADQGYNLSMVAGSNRGYKHTEATRLRMSQAQLGNRVSDETKKKISEANKGRKQTPEEIAKRSEIRKGKVTPQDVRDKISKAQIGKFITPETRANMSAAHRGKKRKPLSDEVKRKISEAQKGKIISAESRAKMSAAKLGKTRIRNHPPQE